MDLRTLGISAALGSAASWAVGAILFQRLGGHFSPFALTLLKGTLSVAFLAIALIVTRQSVIDSHSLLLLVASGLLGIALGDTLFFAALRDLGAHALVVLSTLGEVLTIGLAVVFLGERHDATTWAGIACVVAGIALVLQAKLTEEDKTASRLRGIYFGLLSVLCISVSMIIAKEGLANVSALEATFIRMLSGTLGMFVFGLSTQKLGGWVKPLHDRGLVAQLLLSVAFITFGGFWLSLVSIKYVDVSIANTLNTTDPVFVLILAAIFLKEKITWRSLVGTAATIGGVVLLCAEQN